MISSRPLTAPDLRTRIRRFRNLKRKLQLDRFGMSGLVGFSYINIAPAYEFFIGKSSRHCPGMDNKPITPSRIRRLICVPLWRAKMNQLSKSGFRFLPTFPKQHSYPSPQPCVDFVHPRLHIRNRMVVHPSNDNSFEFSADVFEFPTAFP